MRATISAERSTTGTGSSTRVTRSKTHTRASARTGAVALAGLLACAAVTAHSTSARADEVSPTGKGIVGGGLLGAEVVTITESLAGVRSPWLFVLGGVVGAGGGAVGGYFVEQGSSDGRAPVYMLAGGLALVIPALVLTLNATRYRATEDATEDRAPTNEPSANPGKVGGTSVVGAPTPAPTPTPTPTPAPSGGGATPAPQPGPVTPPPPQSLLDFRRDSSGSAWRMGVPVPEVRPMYSMKEQKELGLPQQAEVRMPVFRAVF